MNLVSLEERDKYFEFFKKEGKDFKGENVDLIVCPSFIHLEAFSKKKGKKFMLGAQDCFSEEKGSYTGETSPLMLKNLGCEYVILGHSERRRYQGETGEEIGLKVASAIKAGLMPIVCVGENMEERKSGKFSKIVNRQIIEALARIKPGVLEKIIIAYEPVWAVGTDFVPNSNQILEMKVLIRKILVELFGRKFGEKPRIIYGGSVSSRTVKETCIESGMDGVLIGRESLVPGEFIRIAEIINKEQ